MVAKKEQETVERPKGVIEERVIYKGRGGWTNNKEGNNDHRNVVQNLKPDYKNSKKEGRSIITETINETLLENGYNLAYEDGTLVPKDELKTEFHNKTSQALREARIFRENANNPELVNDMLGQIREKLKTYGQSLFNEDKNSSRTKRNYNPDFEVSDKSTWVNRVNRRNKVHSEKSPRDDFISVVNSVGSPKGYTEEDFEKEMRDNILKGSWTTQTITDDKNKWRDLVQNKTMEVSK